MSNSHTTDLTGLEIAIIGMAGRFPGARSVDEFWQNLRNGVESVSFFTDEEVEEALGFKPSQLNSPKYVKAGAVLQDVELFDASFFGYSPREAEVMDPQHRIILECGWEALENAGYDSERFDGTIGVYAGASANGYFLFNIFSNPNLFLSMGEFAIAILNEKDHLPTTLSYKLNLRGPSLSVQTSCSTSLVTVHLACQGLISGECDMALAGGVTIHVPQRAGYFFEPGGINSPDGHCRAFDAEARGTVGGNGAGLVVLKRLSDALADGDNIQAVIKGSAINNDGNLKVGYTAPSVEGQMRVISAALSMAEVNPETISYIEAHGTGTPLGDPIEIFALTQVFRAATERKQFCAIGSVKTNLGHLDAASGIAGLIKTVLALKHEQLPANLHFRTPNPKINFADSPFFVNSELREWVSDGAARRAGVNSFGIGGTNVHLVLEQAPEQADSGESRRYQLIVLSARTSSAVEEASRRLARHLEQQKEVKLADVAYTLQQGRREFGHRRIVVCSSVEEAIEGLTRSSASIDSSEQKGIGAKRVAYMMSGQGAQYEGMGRELYERESRYRQEVDRCAEAIREEMGEEVVEIIRGAAGREGTSGRVNETEVAQVALYVVEYSLAKQWQKWGVSADVMIGHSIGEYVAATLAGVMEVEDGVRVVAARGRLMQQLPRGAMLSVPLSENEIAPLLSERLSLAAINAPSLSVVSGPVDAIDELSSQLSQRGLPYSRLHTSHAFHSAMMEPALAEFEELMGRINLNPPKIPYISNLTGKLITDEEATDPNYWARHLRQTVRFSEGIAELMKDQDRVFLEIGPGHILGTLVRQHKNADALVFSSLPHAQDKTPADEWLINTLGKLWLAGIKVDWKGFSEGERRVRLELPSYPFERQPYWVQRKKQVARNASKTATLDKRSKTSEWLYVPVWKQSVSPSASEICERGGQELCWLILADSCGVGDSLAARLEQERQYAVRVIAGEQFAELDSRLFQINAGSRDDYERLLKSLGAQERVPNRIVHLWNVGRDEHSHFSAESFAVSQETGFYSLLYLAQAFGKQGVTSPVRIDVISSAVQRVLGDERLTAGKATLLGPVRVIPQEYPNITARSIDVELSNSSERRSELVERLTAELAAQSPDKVVAYRGRVRWVQSFEPMRAGDLAGCQTRLRQQGVYLITGGLGLIGLNLAEHLARTLKARLVLVGRSSFPSRAQWEQWLRDHDADDPVSGKIRRIQTMEQQGACVLVMSADVASQSQMQEVISKIYEEFGTLSGVIHAAGVLDHRAFLPIQHIGRDECERHFRPKAHGVRVLEEALRGKELDFCLLLSSISSVLGGLGFVAYCASNLFMDAFAQGEHATSPVRWISANWDSWQAAQESQQDSDVRSSVARLAMTTSEGVETFERVLSLRTVAQVVVSTGDLQARIDQWVNLQSLADNQPQTSEAAPQLHKRPSLENAYAAPTNEMERQITNIWQEELGVEQIGVHDSFFDLGGHSLLAIKLTSRLREVFQVDILVSDIFESPTIAQLTVKIVQSQAKQVNENEMTQVLAELEELSESEARSLLADPSEGAIGIE